GFSSAGKAVAGRFVYLILLESKSRYFHPKTRSIIVFFHALNIHGDEHSLVWFKFGSPGGYHHHSAIFQHFSFTGQDGRAQFESIDGAACKITHGSLQRHLKAAEHIGGLTCLWLIQ